MKFELAWVATDQDTPHRVEALTFRIYANSEKEAVAWTEDFLGRNTQAPVRVLWRLDYVMCLSSDL